MIEAKDVSVAITGKRIMNGVNFEARPGEVTAIVGPNGSGKSTLLKAVLGELAYSGRVSLNGRDLASVKPAEIAVDSDPADVLAFDPTATAGLLDVVGDDPGTTLALVFTTPDAAAVFAAADPEVFSDAAVERSREAYLAGNVVGYATPDGDGATRLRAALESLVGPAAPSSTACRCCRSAARARPSGAPSSMSS